jgi:hypothetical protein
LRSRITHQQQDELLALSLRDAAFRAHEALGIIEAQKTASEARKRYLSAKADLEIELDEALLLAQQTAADSGVAEAATSSLPRRSRCSSWRSAAAGAARRRSASCPHSTSASRHAATSSR